MALMESSYYKEAGGIIRDVSKTKGQHISQRATEKETAKSKPQTLESEQTSNTDLKNNPFRGTRI